MSGGRFRSAQKFAQLELRDSAWAKLNSKICGKPNSRKRSVLCYGSWNVLEVGVIFRARGIIFAYKEPELMPNPKPTRVK